MEKTNDQIIDEILVKAKDHELNVFLNNAKMHRDIFSHHIKRIRREKVKRAWAKVKNKLGL